jgi:hypothetical protein
VEVRAREFSAGSPRVSAIQEVISHRLGRRKDMLALLLLLLVLAVFFGGFAVEALFWVAAILLIVWLVGWLAHPAGRRWYYW